jgi:hypothetical protein
MAAVHLAAVVVDEPNRHNLLDIPGDLDPPAKQCEAVDLLLHTKSPPTAGGKVQDEGSWHGYNLLCRAAVAALEETLRQGEAHGQPGSAARQEARPPAGDKALDGRTVLVVGVNSSARALAYGIKKRGGALIIAGHNRQAAQSLAQQFDCRFIQFEALYTTMHEIIVVCEDSATDQSALGRPAHLSGREANPHPSIHPGYLRSGMTVMDLTLLPRKSAFLRDAQSRDCQIVEPAQILIELADLQTHLITGQVVPRERLCGALSELLPEE